MTWLLIRPALFVIFRLAVGCVMRTVEPLGAHGAPYGIMNNSCRSNRLGTLKKISGMTWGMVYQDKGLRWEKISSIQAPAGIDQLYSIHITRSARALVFREGDFMRFLLVSENHDGVYGKK